MKEKKPYAAVFIEAPKPIDAMRTDEKELFIDQIIKALGNSADKAEMN